MKGFPRVWTRPSAIIKNSITRRKLLALEYLKSNQGGTQQACDEILKAFDV